MSAAETQRGAESSEVAVLQPGREPQRIAALFDRIVPRYDLMNRLMTVGMDGRWRAAAAREASPPPASALLDACCGTGDLTLALRRRYPGNPVTGLDFSPAMLARAREKAAAAGVSGVEFVAGDLMDLPFGDGTLSAVTVGWGVRNVADLARALAELRRVTAPGGRVVILEATRPAGRLARGFHAVWFERLVPLIGGALSGEREAYAYLPKSVRTFPDAETLAALMRAAGLRDVRYRHMGLGAMALHVGVVPAVPPHAPAPSADAGEAGA